MRRAVWSLGMILCTVAFAVLTLAGRKDEAVTARIVRVQRGDVHQVAALSGVVRYAEEAYVLAPSSGVVTQVCVQPDQRIAAGEALLRIEPLGGEMMLLAWAVGAEYVPEWLETSAIETAVTASAIRAEEACTVRQVLVKEGSAVSAGTPLARMTSGQQEIVCTVLQADVDGIECGMWAEVSLGDEKLGTAWVEAIGESSADPLTGMMAAEVMLVPEQHMECEEGACVAVDVRLAGSDGVMVLPVEAVTDKGTVWWVGDDGRCTEISAQIVMSDEMYVWVDLPEGLAVAVGEFTEGQHLREASE